MRLRPIELGPIFLVKVAKRRPGHFLVSLLLFVPFSALKIAFFCIAVLLFGEIYVVPYLCTLTCDRKNQICRYTVYCPIILVMGKEKSSWMTKVLLLSDLIVNKIEINI